MRRNDLIKMSIHYWYWGAAVMCYRGFISIIDILILFCDNGSFSIGILHWKFMGPISKAKFNTEGCA